MITEIVKQEVEARENIHTLWFNESGEWVVNDEREGYNTPLTREEILTGNKPSTKITTKKTNN